MNEGILISVHCYQGDMDRVAMLMPVYEHHEAPIVILSPQNSPVALPRHICRHAGRQAYIGQESLDRQIEHLKILLEYPFDYFLLNDSDSFCVSRVIPVELYAGSVGSLWSNEVEEPRPHKSAYPKIAAQPPYFLCRRAIEKILSVAPKIRAHEITPYIDWAMLAWACEAGLAHRAFTELEDDSPAPKNFSDPWVTLGFRICRRGAVMMHPIKTAEQLDGCVEGRKFYEQSLNRS